LKNITAELTSEVRAKNLIIFGLEEKETTLDDTADSLGETLKNCGLACDNLGSSISRLGPKKEGKTRPVRLRLSSESQKWEFLRRINGKRLQGVFARLDLNREEQESDFLLRQELRKRRQDNPCQRYIIRNKQVIQVNN
jgi:hypothetical protein